MEIHPSDFIILIVDDTPTNIYIASKILERDGFQVISADSGRNGIDQAIEQQPHLILLDISMPQMDGYETCKHLKANPATKNIPVIFVSALTSADSKVRGLEGGAVDYMTKPIEAGELLARVKIHLRIQELERSLVGKNDHLTRLDQEKNELFGIVAHDLKNPITSILSSVSMVKRYYNRFSEEDILERLSRVEELGKRMTNLVEQLLDMNALENGGMQPKPEAIDLNQFIEESLPVYIESAEKKDINIDFVPAEDMEPVLADKHFLTEILDNLLSNAIKYSPKGLEVSIYTDFFDSSVQFIVRDQGPGFTEEDKKRLFQKFAKLSARPTDGESSTGLGLSIAMKLVTMLNGSIQCESVANEGAAFIVELPAAE
jgi:signal transduction histidine kinase